MLKRYPANRGKSTRRTKAEVVKDALSFKAAITKLADMALEALREGEMEDVERILLGIKTTGAISI